MGGGFVPSLNANGAWTIASGAYTQPYQNSGQYGQQVVYTGAVGVAGGGWNTVSTMPNQKAVALAQSCTGSAFTLSGPVWVREDISLSESQLALHYQRWAAITQASDYGTIARVDDTGSIFTHPAFCSRETFDAFGEWWTAYSARFENLIHSTLPAMPCGEIGSVFIVKAVGNTEDEFRKVYPSLVGDIWYENAKWIFTDERDAVMAKMLFSQQN